MARVTVMGTGQFRYCPPLLPLQVYSVSFQFLRCSTTVTTPQYTTVHTAMLPLPLGEFRLQLGFVTPPTSTTRWTTSPLSLSHWTDFLVCDTCSGPALAHSYTGLSTTPAIPSAVVESCSTGMELSLGFHIVTLWLFRGAACTSSWLAIGSSA
jgi:hypothetical protein